MTEKEILGAEQKLQIDKRVDELFHRTIRRYGFVSAVAIVIAALSTIIYLWQVLPDLVTNRVEAGLKYDSLIGKAAVAEDALTRLRQEQNNLERSQRQLARDTNDASEDFKEVVNSTNLNQASKFLREFSETGDGLAALSLLAPAIYSDSWSVPSDPPSEDYMVDSRTWANLPAQPVSLTFDAREGQIVILAQVSRVQSDSPERNAEFRLTVNGNEVATTNTGGRHGWSFDALTIHGVAEVKDEEVTVALEYRSPRGAKVVFASDSNGLQMRSLTVLEIPKAVKPINLAKAG